MHCILYKYQIKLYETINKMLMTKIHDETLTWYYGNKNCSISDY